MGSPTKSGLTVAADSIVRRALLHKETYAEAASRLIERCGVLDEALLHLSAVYASRDIVEQVRASRATAQQAAQPHPPNPAGRDELLARSVDECDFSTRIVSALAEMGIRTVGQLCTHTRADFVNRPNFGRKSWNELRGKVDELGLQFGVKP